MEKFLQLDVWWKAKKLVCLAYKITKDFPDCEIWFNILDEKSSSFGDD